jgi:hypothetical protein
MYDMPTMRSEQPLVLVDVTAFSGTDGEAGLKTEFGE